MGVLFLAPMITFTLALIAWAVIPFDAGLVLSDLNVGILYLLAISSLGVYGLSLQGGLPIQNTLFWGLCARLHKWFPMKLPSGLLLSVCCYLWAH